MIGTRGRCFTTSPLPNRTRTGLIPGRSGHRRRTARRRWIGVNSASKRRRPPSAPCAKLVSANLRSVLKRVLGLYPNFMVTEPVTSSEPPPPLDEPVSARVRRRLLEAKKRFHANDNIAAYLEPGDMEALLAEVEGKFKGVLDSLVIDTDSDHNTHETARRVAKMYMTEVFRGRYIDAPAVTEFPNAEFLNELMIVGPITVRSACSHHFCPIMGRLWIGLMPNEHSNLIGLSKYSRLAEWVMSRPQIQEEAITQMASLLMDKVRPDGLAVVMEADHFCMHWRGVKDSETKMVNSVMRGSFLKDHNLRAEFLSLLNLRT